MKILLALLLAATAHAGPLINGNQINPQTAIAISTLTVTGATGITSSTVTVNVDGQTPTALPNSPLRVTGSANSDIQIVVQNKSNGNAANAGFFFVADNGTNLTNSGWCGINGSGYSQASWFDGPDDAVCYALSGNFGIGAAGSGKVVNIFAGGTAAANVVEVISSTGTSIIASGFSVGRSSFSVGGGSATVAYGLTAQTVTDSGLGGTTQCVRSVAGVLTGTGSDCASTSGFLTAGSSPTVTGSFTFGTASPAGAAQASTTTFNDYGAVGANAAGFFHVQTYQMYIGTSAATVALTPVVYYSTTSTGYTPRQIIVEMVAGAGGSAGTTTGGGNGGSTSFGTVNVSSGIGGTSSTGAGGTGGAGGSGGINSVSGVWASSTTLCYNGNGGGAPAYQATVGGMGGASPFGGAAPGGTSAVAGIAGSGSGASGGYSAGVGAGGGGGSGQYCRLIINSPAASYPFYIGLGGIAGTGTLVGAVGGSGRIQITEIY